MGRTSSGNQVSFFLGKVGNILEKIFTVIVILLLIVIVSSTFSQVVCRYVFNNPLIWPEEISRFCYIWISFLGMALLLRKSELLKVDTLLHVVNKKIRRWMMAFVHLLMFITLLVLVNYGMEMLTRIEGQHLTATGIPTQWLYLSVPVSGILALFFLVEITFRHLIVDRVVTEK